MLPDALEALHQRCGEGVIYLNPTVRNPTAQSMPEHRRKDLLVTAARLKLKIIEDDPYWLFTDDAPAPFASLMPQQVYYLSTLSKCISPGLRSAFLLLPSPAERSSFLEALRALSLMSQPLMGALVTQWILDGTAAQLQAAIAKESRERLYVANQILSASGCPTSGGGIHVWQRLPEHWNADSLVSTAHAEGLVVAPSSAFCQGNDVTNAIRISLGGCKRRAELTASLRKLAKIFERNVTTVRPLLV